MKFRIAENQIVFYLLTLGATLNYLFDGLNKFGKIHLPILSRTGIIYRLLLEVICITVIILFINKRRLNWIFTFLFFCLFFFIGNIYLRNIVGVPIFLDEQFIYFNKYFFIFFIFFAVYKILDNEDELRKVIRNFKKLFLFNGLLSVAGLIFNIKLFSTFPIGASRFGYDGLIFAQNEASIFYLLGLFVFYQEWNENRNSFKWLIISLLLCLITGMKAVILGIILLMVFHFFSVISFKRLIYLGIGTITILITLILSVSQLKTIFGYYYWFFLKKGFFYTITGGRNTFIESRVIPYLENWKWLNYLIGGQNISNSKNYLALIEMDIIDVFLFFGCLNGLFYLSIYKYFIVGKIGGKFYFFVIIVFFLLSFFAGHFFTSSVNPIYIIVVFAYLKIISAR